MGGATCPLPLGKTMKALLEHLGPIILRTPACFDVRCSRCWDCMAHIQKVVQWLHFLSIFIHMFCMLLVWANPSLLMFLLYGLWGVCDHILFYNPVSVDNLLTHKKCPDLLRYFQHKHNQHGIKNYSKVA